MLSEVDRRIRASLLIFVAALCWGIEPILNRDYLSGIDPVTGVFWGHLLGCLFLLPLFFRREKMKFQWVKAQFIPAFLVIGLLGAVIAGLLFASSFQQVGAASSTYLLMLRPFCVLVFSSLFLGERKNTRFLSWAVWVLMGATTIFVFDSSFSLSSFSSTEYRLGMILGMLAIAFWSLSTVAAKWVLPKMQPQELLFIRWSLSLVGFFIVMLVQKTEFFPPGLFEAKTLIFMTLSTVVLGLIPIYIYYKGLSVLPARLTSFIALTCPMAVVFVLPTLMSMFCMTCSG